MSNYNNTKATIAANVYTNHANQVTAEMVKTAINAVVDTIIAGGFLYKGVAIPTTNPGTPDANVAYIATTPGTYTNFGSLVVSDGEVAILKYNGGWTKEVTGAATAAQVSELGQKVGKVELNFEANKSIYLNGGIGTQIPAPGASASYSYARCAVTPGDIVIINGVGGSGPRLWGFVDANGIILSVADDSVSGNNLQLTAPENAAEVIINSRDTSTPSYYLSKASLEYNLSEISEVEDAEITHFGVGTINSAGTLIYDPERCYCEVELLQGKDNELVLSDPVGYVIIALRVKDENGNIVSNVTTIPSPIIFKGSTTAASVIVVARKSNSASIAYNEAESLFISNNYKLTLQEAKDKFDSEIDGIGDLIETETNTREFEAAKNAGILRGISEELRSVEEGLENTYRAKSASAESKTLTLPHQDGGYFLLNVHRRSSGQFDEGNNVYFPTAQKDFSDICVTGDNGEILPLRKLFAGNIDILPDQRVPSSGLVFTDSNGVQYGSSGENSPVYSTDNGETWQSIPGLAGLGGIIRFLDSADNLYIFKENILYRSAAPYSSYTQVIDFLALTPGATGIALPPFNFVENPVTHRLFIGAYQESPWKINILVSDDYGLTWSSVYTSNAYQHIHALNVDTNTNPVTIYAGCDGGGGILKSTDNGATWVDLRVANPNIPQSTDQGMLYCGNGFRLAGGETSIVGGVSVQKTTNDADFSTVLSSGKGIYKILELGGKLFGGTISTHPFLGTSIVMSEDNGDTWRDVYNVAPWSHTTASNGFRMLSKTKFSQNENQIVAGCQGARSSVHILVGGDNYYAQFLVKIPAGISSIIVESGHFASKLHNMGNEYPNSPAVYSIPFNTGTDVLEIDSALVKMPLTPEQGGRQVADIFPPIRSARDYYASLIGPDINFYPKDLDLSGGNFHIGFWQRSPAPSSPDKVNRISLIRSVSTPAYAIVLERSILKVGNQSISTPLYPNSWPGVWIRIDINFTSDGKCILYCNGSTNGGLPISLTDSPIQHFTQNDFYVLFIQEHPASNYELLAQCIQRFEITQGNITAEQAWLNYTGGLFDIE